MYNQKNQGFLANVGWMGEPYNNKLNNNNQ